MLRVTILCSLLAVLLVVGSASAASVSLKISGPGAVNDSTIKAGEKFSLDVYILNDAEHRFLQLGFEFTSPDIAAVTHPADSGNGKNPNGDVKVYGGFVDASIFDVGGLHVVETDWDGKMPELLGFGGLCVQNSYQPHELARMMSVDLIFDKPGTVVIDSSFFPPKGEWMFVTPEKEKHFPVWGGPYRFTVVD